MRSAGPAKDRARAGSAADAVDARRAAGDASTAAQRQLLAPVIIAPEVMRAAPHVQSTRVMLTTAAGLRPTASSGDLEVATALTGAA
jgi:transposase